MLMIVVGAALLWLNVSNLASGVALVLIGSAVAPLFPSFIARTPERLGQAHTANAIGFQVSAAVLGVGGLSALTGLLVERIGLEAVAPLILVAAIVLIVLYEVSNVYTPAVVRVRGVGETSLK
jgi:predicted MFS family arabinose efflux permease